MTTFPLVSICIPTFNNEKFIKDTLNSIINQTYKNIEIIISDDCSTDNTLNVVKKNNDKRICLYTSEENRGIEYNWNKSITKANGKYIKIIGADDILELNCIEYQVQILENHEDITLVTSHKNIINQQGKKILKIKFPGISGKTNGIIAVKKSLKKGTNVIGEPGAGLFRRKTLKNSGLFNGENIYLIDLDFWSRLLLFGDLYIIDKVLFNFRISRYSISNSLGLTQFKYFNRFAKKIYESKNHQITRLDLYMSYFRAFINNIVRNLIFLIQ